MNPSEIKQTLDAEQILLTKSLGQNFLHDVNQLRRIVEAAELTAADQVLEIGPGLGALTHLILEKSPHLLALETDGRLFRLLQARLAGQPGLELVHADALAYLRENRLDWSAWKVVSNLPYSVASSILVELAKNPAGPRRMVVTLQWEVAQRLMATAGQDAYGVLTLMVQSRYVPHGLFKIPAPCFFPVPGVDSACMTWLRRPAPLLDPQQFRTFEKIIKRGFSQRRKMMLKLLKADWPLPALEKAFAEVGITPEARAETVSLPQFIELTRRLSRNEPL
jgi:16S rRNA (adenine1518-N6/adenine1519-N6)-dimethyltransferase